MFKIIWIVSWYCRTSYYLLMNTLLLNSKILSLQPNWVCNNFSLMCSPHYLITVKRYSILYIIFNEVSTHALKLILTSSIIELYKIIFPFWSFNTKTRITQETVWPLQAMLRVKGGEVSIGDEVGGRNTPSYGVNTKLGMGIELKRTSLPIALYPPWQRLWRRHILLKRSG